MSLIEFSNRSVQRIAGLIVFFIIAAMAFEGALFVLSKAELNNKFIISINKSLYFGRWFHDVMESSDSFEYIDTRLYDLKPNSSIHFKNIEYDVTMAFDGRRSRIAYGNVPYDYLGNNYGMSLGDSVTMGWGVSSNETYSAVLQRKLGITVINFGVSSYNTYRSLIKCLESGLLKSSSFIVIQYHINDLDENLAVLRDGPKLYKLEDYKNRILAVKEAYGDHYGSYRPFDYLTRFKDMIINGEIIKASGRAGRNIELEARVFFSILDMLPEYKSKKIIVFDGSEYEYQVKEFSDNFNRVAAEHGYINLKAINVAYGTPDYFYYDNHQNKNGHRKIAEAVYIALSKTL